MYYVDQYCPICQTGTVCFRICSDNKHIVLMCDECDSIWLDPNIIEATNVVYPVAPNFTIPGLTCSVKSPQSRWATKQEIAKQKWLIFIDE